MEKFLYHILLFLRDKVEISIKNSKIPELILSKIKTKMIHASKREVKFKAK